MGDAVRGGDVHAADPEDTIDGAAPRPEPVPETLGLPPAVVAATRDYQELAAVERHHYAITREIARGGIGRVFEARDLRLGRQVAIKELLPKNRDAARRFEREARITARLQHPAIIHVYEAGVWPGGEPFYAMPLVSGRSLDKVVAEKLTLAERLGLLPNVIAVADALAYAHNANVIHRDLKPANVLVGEFGETVVIDWGLAKDLGAYSDPKESLQMRLRATAEETMSGSVVGTPAYMPPEQARGDAVDQRADVYALGGLLYKVLSGVAPYSGTTSQEVVEQVKAGPPVPVQEREPAAPPDLVAIVAKAMARNVDARYITASELAQDLKRFETGQLVGAHRYTIGELLRRWLRRHRVAVSIASAALIALIVLGVFFVRRNLEETRRADAERDKANAGRVNLLEERGRIELLDNHAGNALAYLVGAAADGKLPGARGFLIADAMRSFEAERAHIVLERGGAVPIAVSPNGKLIAMAGNRKIELRTPENVVVGRPFPTSGTTRIVRFDASNTRFVAAGDDGVARVWSIEGALVAKLQGHHGPVLDAVFSPDGTLVATAGDDKSVRIWTIASATAAVIEGCHQAAVVSVRFSPNGQKLLTASADSTAAISEVATHSLVRKIQGHTASVNSAEWSPDGQFIVTASDDGTARVWSELHGKPVIAAALRHEPGTTVRVALMSSDDQVITAGSDKVIRVWELPGVVPEDGTTPPPIKLPKKLFGHSGPIVAAAFSADESRLVTAGLDGLAKLWDWREGQEIATFEHSDVVGAVAFVPETSRLVTSSRDGIVKIWDTHVSERPIDLGYAIRDIAVGPHGEVAAALGDSLVRIVHGHGSEPDDLHGHLASVNAVAFMRGEDDHDKLISAGEDAAAIIWDLTTGTHTTFAADTRDPPAPIEALALDQDRVALVRAGKIEVWSLAGGERMRLLAVAGGSIERLAINPVTHAITGVGHDGTLATWNSAGKPLGARTDASTPYNAVAYSPKGDVLVTAGPGVVNVWKVVNDVIDKVDVTLDQGEMGVVREVLVTPDGSLVITAGDNGRAMIWDREKGKLLGARDRHDKMITSLALSGDKLWVASEDQMLSTWDVRIEKGSVRSLNDFMEAKHVPVELHEDVVGKKAP